MTNDSGFQGLDPDSVYLRLMFGIRADGTMREILPVFRLAAMSRNNAIREDPNDGILLAVVTTEVLDQRSPVTYSLQPHQVRELYEALGSYLNELESS